MRPLVPFIIIAAMLAASCGGDATGPKTDLSGRWAYGATNVSGSSVSCNLTGISLTMSQSGNTFTGSSASGTVACSGPGGSTSGALGNDVVSNGQVNGNAVQFDIGTQDFHNTGTISGNSMSGTVTLRVNFGVSNVVLSGNFSAVRQ